MLFFFLINMKNILLRNIQNYAAKTSIPSKLHRGFIHFYKGSFLRIQIAADIAMNCSLSLLNFLEKVLKSIIY